MTSFVHVDQPTVHPGVERAEILLARIQAARAGGNGARPLIALLILAVLAAAAVVADNLVTHWDEGALLAAWAVLSAAVFAGVALYASTLRSVFARVAGVWNAAAQRRAAARADARFLATAKSDPRIMQELQAATWREESQGKIPAAAAAKVDALARMAERSNEARMPTIYEAMRRMNSSRYY